MARVRDEDGSHTADGSRDAADELGIEILGLPKRSPPLNPMDHLGRHGKGVRSANHQDASIEEQGERFIDYLDGLSAFEALTKAGSFSKDLWLKLGCQ